MPPLTPIPRGSPSSSSSTRRPDNAQLHVLLGLALAYLGRKEEAIREGERAVAWTAARTQNGKYFQHQLARIYILTGEQEKALDRLEPLLKKPYYLSPGWLRIDPTFRSDSGGNSRFLKLVEELRLAE